MVAHNLGAALLQLGLGEAAEFLAEGGWPDEAEALQSEIAERQLVAEVE